MSATVSSSSSFSRSGLCTTSAKSRIVFGIGQIAALRDVAHRQVLLDQPDDGLGLRRRQAEARTQLAGDARADDRVILGAALADVVQERGDVQGAPVLDGADDLGRQRQLVAGAAALDVGQHADGAHEMLVDRIAVVHVELRHADDAAELGHEAAEHAGLVHAPQRHLGIGVAGQQIDEDAVGLRVVAQLVVDQPLRLAQQPDRVRDAGTSWIGAPRRRSG